MAETKTNSDGMEMEVRRFRANPVEVVILMTVALVLCNSVYNLFYDTQGFRPAALKNMAANPISEGRSPASLSSAFMSAELNCGTNFEKDTSATKVRLSGPLCGIDDATQAGQLTRATILNETNKFSATVFTDTNAAKFSTDYIPLTTGKNAIKVEFAFRGGKVVTQDVAITKF